MMANAMINSQNQDNWALSQNKMYESLCIFQYSETEFYDTSAIMLEFTITLNLSNNCHKLFPKIQFSTRKNKNFKYANDSKLLV